MLTLFAEIQYLTYSDLDSTEIVKTNMMDTYFLNRSVHLENLCLYEVVHFYTYINNMEENIEAGRSAVSGCYSCLVRYSKVSLINHCKLSCVRAEKQNSSTWLFCNSLNIGVLRKN